MRRERTRRGDLNIAPLLLNVETLAPEHIIVLDAGAYDAVRAPMEKAGLPLVDIRVPALTAKAATEFRQKLRQALVRADLEKLIRPLTPPRVKL